MMECMIKDRIWAAEQQELARTAKRGHVVEMSDDREFTTAVLLLLLLLVVRVMLLIFIMQFCC